jgi:hypothetical protein
MPLLELTSYKSLTVSMKKAASSENRAIREAMAYSGTLQNETGLSISFNPVRQDGLDSHEHNPDY